MRNAIALYEEACKRDDAHSGYYNRNVRVPSDDGAVMVRIPTPGSDSMDLTMWREQDLLDAIRAYVGSAPQLLHAQSDPPFQIHEFIEGDLLDDVCPAGTPIPDRVFHGIQDLFGQLLRVPSGKLPGAPEGWPEDGDTVGFAGRLFALVRDIRAAGDGPTQELYRELGVPEDPCAFLVRAAGDLQSRPFRLLHADIHRKNIIVGPARTVFLDWELALWGDPVYDLADHLHKMAYLPDEEKRMRAAWAAAAPAECRAGWAADVRFYLAYERMKSAVVDTVRWARLISAATTEAERRTFARELGAKFDAARPFWGPDARTASQPADFERAAARWARRTARHRSSGSAPHPPPSGQ
ncbi:phosphotransferase family protein [Streptomyces niger]|uniref:phosphotransferase family protein n=1 Tax=Streptomyces niger TaxID=66373 RepID=UPI00069B344B|nr:aminoglycoside phosphotransferase family protein [Streptomyces niger]